MRTWLTPRRLLSGVLILLALIQFVPTWLWNTNPAVVSQPKWDSPQAQALVQRACFDCHSNQTAWP